MRILVFHGYLLRGTGSNVYNARLCAALARQGHQVDLLCQDRAPEELAFVDAVGELGSDGTARVCVIRTRPPARPGPEPGVTVWRPDIGSLLPVYVADRYEGLEARTYLECSDEEIAAYVERNVAAVRAVAAHRPPDAALANHLVMGPLILARALDPAVPYAVKIHGSALEYTVKLDPVRFLPAATEGLERAATVLVGSRHTAESLWAALGDPALPARTRLGPPGVDVDEFRPLAHDDAVKGLDELKRGLRAGGPAAAAVSAFSRDAAEAAAALERLDPAADRLVAFVGKLIVSKGIDLLAAGWPLVLAEEPAARLVVVGFGAYRAALERLLGALAAGDLDAVRELAAEGRAAEGGPRAPLRHLAGFLDGLEADAGARERYVRAAAALPERVVLTGRLEHEELAPLLALCEAQVVPSTFPEAFGMVAAEAAACGALPISAAHSGLAEVSAALAAAVPEPARELLAFDVDSDAPRAIAARIVAWLRTGPELRAATREALVRTARARYSWEGVARDLVAAMAGRHDDLPPPA